MFGAKMIPQVSMSQDEFYDLIRSEAAHAASMVSYIDQKGLQHFFDQTDYISYLGAIDKLLVEKNTTIKVEKYETVCKFNKGTVHIFCAWENSPSFDTHTDPVDLIMQITHGAKSIEINGAEVVASSGHSLYVPKNTPHKATNKYASIMLSWGLDDYT